MRLRGELFSVTTRDKRRIVASQFHLDGLPTCGAVEGRAPDAAQQCRWQAGAGARPDRPRFSDAAHRPARDLARHAARRHELRARGVASRIGRRRRPRAGRRLLDLDLDKAWTAGTTTGSPVVADDRVFGFEHPMAETRIDGAHVLQFVRRVLPLRAGVPVDYSAVYGVAPAGQLRRGFMAYLENERATPFRTFLHYNSWYDIGYFTPYTEQEAVGVIEAYGRKLVKERGVHMDSFLFDDGWDDHRKLWQFNDHFPHGFTPVREAAERIGAEPGVWLSPWGGYGPPRQERLAAAKAGGFEVDDQGLALSGPKYYALFHDATLGLLKNYGINQFKLDGTGSPDKVTPGSEFDSDFAAAIALIGDLRAVKPDLFINLTTGTWPSPFWLRTADSIWRGGEDHSFAGIGSYRQQWITYRDADTYGGIVRLESAVPAELADAARHRLRPQGARPGQRSARRLRRRGALLLRQRHRPAGDVHLAGPAHRAQLGRPRRRGEVGARQCADAARQPLDRRRPGAAAGLRLGRLEPGARDRHAAQPERPAAGVPRSTSAPRWNSPAQAPAGVERGARLREDVRPARAGRRPPGHRAPRAVPGPGVGADARALTRRTRPVKAST